MKILLIGSGGREHALAWKIRQNKTVTELYIAPGNGGTALLGKNIDIKDTDIDGLVAFAKEHAIDLVVAGPETPLVLGIEEALAKVGIPCFGPNPFAAQLEGSKAFSKQMMVDAGVPTAQFRVFEDFEQAMTYVRAHSLPMVIKADGLAAGKGVVIAKTLHEAEEAVTEMMKNKAFGSAGLKIIVEEALEGEEASFLAFCDGENVIPMPSSQDHKRIGDDDTGPNTGGMGAYSPAPVLPAEEYEAMAKLTITPIVRHMAKLGHPFKGILYAGIMMTAKGPMVLEYNVRFGDPECQPLMTRLKSDLVAIMQACIAGKLQPDLVEYHQETSCCIVMAAQGYPGSYPKGMVLSGIDEAEGIDGVHVFQAGTKIENSQISTTGGRVLGVTALGSTLAEARQKAYQAVHKIHFDNCYFRTDIANKGLRR